MQGWSLAGLSFRWLWTDRRAEGTVRCGLLSSEELEERAEERVLVKEAIANRDSELTKTTIRRRGVGLVSEQYAEVSDLFSSAD